ncbi:MAG: hypothetical protein OEY64_08550 [Nitrospinota bacterium]|nr:hypothetical protein [Nitrospinota bacterium]
MADTNRTIDPNGVPAEAPPSIKELIAKIDALIAVLSREKSQPISVKVENTDGAIAELVSRVLEEIIIRARQENILKVLNG